MQQIKLPRLTLNNFNGDLTEWTSFWDSFQSTIHLNNQLSKVDTIKSLISCLQGEAKDKLAGFHLTDAHYDQAIDHLMNRYHDKEYIIHMHYNRLSNLTKSSNATM